MCACAAGVGLAPSASRNALVPPMLRWLPSTKMAARIPQSNSSERAGREGEQERWENILEMGREKEDFFLIFTPLFSLIPPFFENVFLFVLFFF